ncbi:MAG: RHS repeat-associated core domain-containing protein [Pseudomonadales bacterium]|nr:RHS repeat-associated core domain-containing protein [Pseudomonadales bacterium]MBH2036408.1 RHS repeat-associated core domain-containing protein [Pseudomonadales bacterium]MBH2079680.1 RHS repeat-associated core domain-containing protein [Pseudomonadales bacterium]
MPHDSEMVLCQYHYDPLDRLVETLPLRQQKLHRFYCKRRLITKIQGEAQYSLFQQNDKLLALQQIHRGSADTTLLAADQKQSVLLAVGSTLLPPFAYTPFGHRSPQTVLLHMIGFNGECPDPMTGHYLLGNGYRAYNPVLMRFNSPDSWSPFGEGGINPYAAFKSDPINQVDPTGHAPFPFMVLKAANRFKSGLKSMKKHAINASTDKQILGATPLQDHLPANVPKDIAQYRLPTNTKTIEAKLIARLKDLDILSKPNSNYKYIFTDRSELIVGRIGTSNTNEYFTHPVLAQLARSPNVISAGHIAIRESSIVLSNQTGHYFGAGDTTGLVIPFLNRLGVKASLLRNERSFTTIPPSYTP